MTRREPKVRDTRDRVLSAALEVFAAKGFAATSVDNIVERAGCTRAAPSTTTSKVRRTSPAILQRDLWHRLAERAQDAFDPGLGTIANLKRAFDVHLATLSELGEARFFLREGWLNPVLEASGRTELSWGVALIRELLVAAMDRGEVVAVEPEALAALLTGLFEVATTHTLEVGDPTATVEVVHLLLDGLSVSNDAMPQMSTAGVGGRLAPDGDRGPS